ncbi:MAG: methyltransferase domain-containing protein [Myxococcales bacterium]|nr:methyltransferase domain-containing protein [Myxococcales bacterium]
MDTEKLYDADAGKWRRRKPNSLSDFTGRPAVFELCGDVTGLRVADVGCGEGYCTRELKHRGAAEIVGIELSAKMVEQAQAQEAEDKLGIEYRQGNVLALDLPDGYYDLVTAVFVFNYLTRDECRKTLEEVHRILKPGGHFVYSIPHPCFPFMKDRKAPFFFDFQENGYFSGLDTKNEGEIHCLDGTALRVQMIHKPLEEYFNVMRAAGFTLMPEVRELRVQPEHLESNPEFFGPVNDIPLHMAFRIQKS